MEFKIKVEQRVKRDEYHGKILIVSNQYYKLDYQGDGMYSVYEFPNYRLINAHLSYTSIEPYISQGTWKIIEEDDKGKTENT